MMVAAMVVASAETEFDLALEHASPKVGAVAASSEDGAARQIPLAANSEQGAARQIPLAASSEQGAARQRHMSPEHCSERPDAHRCPVQS